MSKYDNYGGVTHDPELDGGDVIDWNPVENLDIDDAEWEETYADPTEWNEATVSALVWTVEVPPHDAEGNVVGTPYLIPEQFIGATEIYVSGCYFDWGHACDGFYSACPKGTTLEQAQMFARNACDGPLEAADCFLTCEDDWLPGNPKFIFDDSDPDNKVVYLRYWRPGALEPYDSEAIGFDDDPAKAIWEYVCRMGWEEKAPNQ